MSIKANLVPGVMFEGRGLTPDDKISNKEYNKVQTHLPLITLYKNGTMTL